MKKIPLALVLPLIMLSLCFSQDSDKEIKLLIRGDDIGFSHAANIGCINYSMKIPAWMLVYTWR